ncbi:MAG: preprotein translocase subunit YajC [Planctomycetota bacterium]
MHALTNLALLWQETAPAGGGGAPGEGGTPPPQGLGVLNLMPLILVGVLAWFLLIAPERKRQKERQAMLAALKKNDKVVTAGGMVGVISRIDDNEVVLRIDDGVHVTCLRSHVSLLATAAE